jgi:tryptophanyl-tRNA synthetase
VLDAAGAVPETTRQERPEAYNLLAIYAALANQPMAAVLGQFAGAQFSQFKAALTDLAVASLAPIGAEMQHLCADPGAVDAVLRDGAERARAIAEPNLAEIYDIVGFLRP